MRLYWRLILALLAGACAVFAFAPFNCYWLIFVAYSGLLWLISFGSRRQAMLVALSWGIGYFSAGIHWVYISMQQFGEMPAIGAAALVLLLVLYLSLYVVLFSYLTRRIGQAFSWLQLVLVAPAIWQLTEFLRGYILTGFPWLQPGYSQLNSPLAGFLPLFGVNGLNLLLLMLCGLIVYALHQPRWTRRIYSGLTILCIFILGALLKQHHWTQADPSRHTTIALLQGNIQQSMKWQPEQLQSTLARYNQLTNQALADGAKIIIWPESAITDFERNQQAYLQSLDFEARNLDANIALGIIDYRFQSAADPAIYNTLLVLGAEQPYSYFAAENRYNKYHLVPFGEFIPLSDLLKPIAEQLAIPLSSMTRGHYIQPPLQMQHFKFLTAICYEITLPQQIWDNFTPDTDFLLTVSNDAWFGDSIGPWQHLQMAQTRATEFGRPLIRSTNNGITVVTDRQGQIVKQLPQFTSAILMMPISATSGQTPYAKWGNYPYWIATWLLLLLAIAISTRKRSQNMA